MLGKPDPRYSDLRLPLSERLPIVTYTNLFESLPRTVWMSPQVETLTGYRTQEWVNRPGFFESILHPDDRAAVIADVHASRAELRPFSRDYRILRRDGEIMWIHDESVPILDRGGRPELMQGYFIDITSRKELEQQLLHAQKVEALGRLATEIAHEFNNHLTAISGHVALLQRDVMPDAPAHRRAREIAAAADRAAALTRRLLAYGRRETSNPRRISINAVLTELTPMLERIAGSNVALKFELRAAPDVHADPAQIEQVITNLVANARDAMPGGGGVTIRSFELPVLPGLMAERFQVAPGTYSVLLVWDSGPGIDPATQARIFEPYFTTKGRGQGTGLGLSIVDMIVRQAGGGIAVDSAPGRGTRFRILLPAARNA